MYSYGHNVDEPLSIARFGYADRPSGGSYTLWNPFVIAPLWDAQGRPVTGAFGDGRAVMQLQPGGTQCATGNSVNRCVLLYWPLSWSAYDQRKGAEPPAWFGTLLEDKRDHAGTSFRRNRAYDPTTGRFTQEDPIGLAGGLNLYGYAGGDPVNFSDPFGLCPQWLTGRPCSGGVDLGASFLPGVSSGIDAATLLSGQNPLTGEDVGVVGRGIALTGLITPAGGGQIRAAGKTISRVTGDFVNRVIGRGVKNEQILDALRNPLKVKGVVLDAQGRPSQQIIGREATVVQNPETGDLVTTWRTSGRLRKRLEPPPE